METLICNNTNLYLLPAMLTEDQCSVLMTELDRINMKQGILELPDVSRILWQFIGPKISSLVFTDLTEKKQFRVTGIRDSITITMNNKPVIKHFDKATGDRFKLSFYLNKIDKGGTIFYGTNTPDVIIDNEPGAGILFDICVEHEGMPLPGGETKYVIGARPVIEYEGGE